MGLYVAATVALYLRLCVFCMISDTFGMFHSFDDALMAVRLASTGPMIQMIYSMLGDILTFLVILLILFLGFTFSLSFLLGDRYAKFETIDQTMLTLFMAALGEFEFDGI